MPLSIKFEGYLKTLYGFAPGALHWTAENIPDMGGKVVIITGGNTGPSNGALADQ